MKSGLDSFVAVPILSPPFEEEDDISTVASVDEDGLPGGNLEGPSDLGGSATVVTGTIPYSFGSLGAADFAPFSWSSSGLPSLSSQGEALHYVVSPSGKTLAARTLDGQTVLHLTVTDIDTGAYRLALRAPLDHPITGNEDDLAFSVKYTIRDSQNNQASARVGIVVDDDSPTNTIDSPVAVDAGDNVTGFWRQRGGADGVDSTKVTLAGSTTEFDLDQRIFTPQGSLTVNSNGSFTLDASPNITSDTELVFQIVTTDGDGDSVASEGRISVNAALLSDDRPTTPLSDGDLATASPLALLDEDGLPGGEPGGIGDIPGEATVAMGNLGYDFGDDGAGDVVWETHNLPDIRSGGTRIDWQPGAEGKQLTGLDADGRTALHVELLDVEDGTYRVTLARPLDHGGVNIEDNLDLSFGYRITDSDGDSALGELLVRINDDSPVKGRSNQDTPAAEPLDIAELLDDGESAGKLTDPAITPILADDPSPSPTAAQTSLDSEKAPAINDDLRTLLEDTTIPADI